MRPSRVALWFAVAGAFAAILFLALGRVSEEPLDHPQWLMAGYWPVLACYSVLIGFCLPGACLYGLLLYALRLCGLIAGNTPLGQWSYVVYPLMQGAFYGGAAWILASVGNSICAKFRRRRIRQASPGDSCGGRPQENGTEIGSSSSAGTQTGVRAWGRTCRRFLVIVVPVVVLSIALRFILLPTLPSTWRTDFDRDRYVQIYEAIKADEHHLLGKSLDEVSKRFGLEDVPWDGAGVQVERDCFRIYHFQGFALYVTVDLQLPEDSPLRRTGYSGEELRRYGVLRLADQPYVQADGINDPKERMKRYWDAMHEESARINAEMKRERQKKR